MKYRKIFCSRYTHVSNVPERAETEVKVVTRRNHDISIPVRRYSLEGRFWFAQFESLQTPQRRGGYLPTAQPLQPPFLVRSTYCHPVPIPGKVTEILGWSRCLFRYKWLECWYQMICLFVWNRCRGHLPTAQPLQPTFLVGPTYCHPVPIPGTLRPHATGHLKTIRAYTVSYWVQIFFR